MHQKVMKFIFESNRFFFHPRNYLYHTILEREVRRGSSGFTLNDTNILISRKAGAEGKLYGSIGTVDIVEAVIEQSGIDLAKHEVRLPEGPIRDIGEHKLAIQLHADVSATITVNVVSEEES